jgi:hypothetical protein
MKLRALCFLSVFALVLVGCDSGSSSGSGDPQNLLKPVDLAGSPCFVEACGDFWDGCMDDTDCKGYVDCLSACTTETCQMQCLDERSPSSIALMTVAINCGSEAECFEPDVVIVVAEPDVSNPDGGVADVPVADGAGTDGAISDDTGPSDDLVSQGDGGVPTGDGTVIVDPDTTADGGTGCDDECIQGQKGCDGNLTWSCDYDADGCLTMFQGNNCAALSQVCDPATGTCKSQDGTTPDKLLCPDILPCALDACSDIDPNVDQAGFQACAQAALTTCMQQAETQNETLLFQGWLTCLQTFCATVTTDADLAECQRTNCLAPTADCYSGGIYGGGVCSDIDACIQGSCAPPIATGCLRSCLNETAQDGVAAFFDLQLCTQGACMGQADQDACFQQVVNTPVCSEPFTTCLGDQG